MAMASNRHLPLTTQAPQGLNVRGASASLSHFAFLVRGRAGTDMRATSKRIVLCARLHEERGHANPHCVHRGLSPEDP